MWLFGCILPYMIEYTPPTDVHWQTCLQLLQIVDVLFALSISEDEVGYLSVLITVHFIVLQLNALAETPLCDPYALYTPLPLCRRAVIDGHTYVAVTVKHHLLGTIQA